jgi:glycine dehydrogenase subunit 1
VQSLHSQPVIREFAVRLRGDVAEVKRRCAAQGVNPGVDLERITGRAEDRGGLLVAITEQRSRADIDRLAEVLGAAMAVVGRQGHGTQRAESAGEAVTA